MIKVLKSVVAGPLEPYAAGFATELERQGYTAGTAEKQVALAAHLSRWLAAAGTGPGDLTVRTAERYASARRAAGYAGYKSAHALEPLLGYLRGLGVVPAAEPQPVTPAQALLERFQRYLVSERGIGSATAESYVCFVRPFIAARLGPGGPGLEGLSAADVTAFVAFAANIGDLWFPAMDVIVCVLPAGQLLVLVLDHEELITLSRLGVSQAARYTGHERGVRGGWPGSLDAGFLALLALVRDGTGLRDARQLDLLISARFRPREGRTVLEELIELERSGFVRRAAGGTGYRWAVTDAGSEALS